MNSTVRRQLLNLNRTFYSRFAAAFSATRFAAQPGYTRIIRYFPPVCHVLDLGCGNARFAHFLDTHVERAVYLGVDVSAGLLHAARERAASLARVRARFLLLDLGEPGWAGVLDHARFDVVLALAILHHMPGAAYREAFVREAASLLKPDGYIIFSNWRFLHSERMRRKIVPWEQIGLTPADVEAGDYLMDWKKEGRGYRYVHQVTEEEMEALAASAGLQVVEQFHSDGREGDLGLYTVLVSVRQSSTVYRPEGARS